MIIDMSTIVEQLASLTEEIEGLIKCMQELVAKLFKVINNMDSMTEGDQVRYLGRFLKFKRKKSLR